MERPTDELVQRLLAAVAAGAGGDASRVVHEARVEAEAEVKELIKSAMKAVLLRRVVGNLEQPEYPSPPADEPDPTGEAPAGSNAAPAAGTPTEELAREGLSEGLPQNQPAACYVYAITRTNWGAPPPDLRGIDGRSPLRAVRGGSLQAVVSTVSLSEFGAAVLGERLKDLQWVEENVRRHDAAVKALSAVGTVIPCRFCTIVSGEDEARAALATHRDAIVRTLESIDGKTEWGVKLLADTRSSAAGGARAGQTDPAGESGRAYLMQKKRHGRQREDMLRSAAEAAEACHRALFTLAADAAILPARDRGGSSRGWHLAMNAAYLVADADTQAFHTRVATLAEQYRAQGLRIDLTGPWPPYNFSALNLSDAPAT